MTKEALKQRLGMAQPNRGSVGFQEALAQPEQEPVAWIYSQGTAKVASMNYVPGVRATPLYTSPPAQRKPLTDEEIAETLTGYRLSDAIDITRAIEAAHGIKG